MRQRRAQRKKNQPVKTEDEAAAPPGETLLDYRDVLRLHFQEPMHCEVRDRTVRVACGISFIPELTQDPRDLTALIKLMAPRHVVFLPSADADLGLGLQLKKELRYARLPAGTRTPEVHCLAPSGAPLSLALRSLKRRIQFNNELWQKMSFLRTSDGVRVARVRAEPATAAEGSEARVLELAPAVLQATADANAGTDEVGSSLPREGALFLGLAKDPLSLSGLKEQMQDGDWAADVADFKPPNELASRPWSSRILVADKSVALGWVTKDRVNGAGNGGTTSVLRVEGVPGSHFFKARAALYRSCALV